MGGNLCPGCSISDHPPGNPPGKAVEDDQSAWASTPAWETQVNLLAPCSCQSQLLDIVIIGGVSHQLNNLSFFPLSL